MSTVLFAASPLAHQLPGGFDPLASHRAGAYTWEVLDLSERRVGTLAGASGGTVDLNTDAPVRGSGSVGWSGEWGAVPEWDRVRLRPRYTATLVDGSALDIPLGVFLPTTPALTEHHGAATGDVGFYDKTVILAQDRVEVTFGLPVGTQVIPAVEAVIAGSVLAGDVALEESTETLRTAMVWPAGTTKLAIVNDLLEAVDYVAVWADGAGTIRSSHYDAPAARPLQWAFEHGEDCVYMGGFTQTRDTWDVPNRVIARTQGDGDEEGLVSVADLDDVAPGHPLSYASRGRWVAVELANVDATSQAVLDQIAARHVLESVQTATTVELAHAPLPLLLDGRCTFTHPGAPTRQTVLRSLRVTCDPGALWSSTLLEVVT